MELIVNPKHVSCWSSERANKFVKNINTNGKNQSYFQSVNEENIKNLTKTKAIEEYQQFVFISSKKSIDIADIKEDINAVSSNVIFYKNLHFR